MLEPRRDAADAADEPDEREDNPQDHQNPNYISVYHLPLL
jgi:hypothetical protein